jgi:hypothetical protein
MGDVIPVIIELDFLKLVGSALVAIAGLFFAYHKHVRDTEYTRRADDTTKSVIALKSQLWGFLEYVKLFQQMCGGEEDSAGTDSSLEGFVQAYKRRAAELAQTISSIEATGTMLFVISPAERMYTVVVGLRTWLEVVARPDYQTICRDSQGSWGLNIGAVELQGSRDLLARLMSSKDAELRASVKKKHKNLKLLDDVEEIGRMKDVLGELGSNW